jgi:hypothetical protein
MLPNPMHFEDHPAFEPRRLLLRRSLEWLRMRAEPDLDNAISAQALIDPAGDRFNFRQFRHL